MSGWGKQGGKKSGGGGGGGWNAGGGGGKWAAGGGGGGWSNGGKGKGSDGTSKLGKGKGEETWWGDGGWDAWEGRSHSPCGPNEDCDEKTWQKRMAKRMEGVRAVKRQSEYILPLNAGVARPRTPDPTDKKLSKRAWEAGMQMWRSDLQHLVRVTGLDLGIFEDGWGNSSVV